MAYNLDFYAESRQHAVAYLSEQSLAPEIEAMLTTAIVNVTHGGPMHVKASGGFPEGPDASLIAAGSFEVAPVEFVDVVPAAIADETPHPGWKAWLDGVRHPDKAKADKAHADAKAAPAAIKAPDAKPAHK